MNIVDNTHVTVKTNGVHKPKLNGTVKTTKKSFLAETYNSIMDITYTSSYVKTSDKVHFRISIFILF